MPHPLVANVAHELKPPDGWTPTTVTAGARYPTPQDEAGAEAALTGVQQMGKADDEDGLDTADALEAALMLVGAEGLPQLVTFTGYLGASIAREGSGPHEWTVLYLDSGLRTWLLVQTVGLVFRKQISDERSPFGFRDAIWVKDDALVGHGMGSFSVEAQFLSGDFTSAADFEAPPLGGGTLSAATGVFCEGRSPGCCRKTPR